MKQAAKVVPCLNFPSWSSKMTPCLPSRWKIFCRSWDKKNLEFAFDLTGALKIAENRRFSIAFLDVNLNGELSLPVARVLRQHNIPFYFTTGFGSRFDYEDMQGTPIVRKPYSEQDIRHAIESVKSN
tara:strand:+ start:2997 stop:3377 length:381 start_codon:yes stop_codon:yes gene_type:complete